jgi:hypothetical protein
VRAVLATGLAIALPACAFLLDFDELQEGGGSGGSAEGGTCPESCDDFDPCTIDHCDAAQDPPVCVHDPAFLVDDGLDYTEEVKFAYRVSLTAGSTKFYASSFVTSGTAYDVRTYSFDGASDTVSPGPSFSELQPAASGFPVSAFSLAADKSKVPFEVNGYLAIGADIGPTDVGRVYRITLDENLGVTGVTDTSGSANYAASSVFRAPSAFKVEGGPVWGTWIGPGDEVLVHPGTGVAQALSNSAGAQVAAPAAGPNAQGGAFYISDAPKVQLPTMSIASPINECNTEPATAWLSASTTYSGIENIWLVTWTKATGQSVVSQTQTFSCTVGFCAEGLSCVEAPGVRNQVYALLRRNLDPSNILYEFIARPAIDPGAGEGVLSLLMVRARLAPVDAGGGAELIQSLELARYPLGSKGEGPDWPAIALLGEDRVGVAWIEQHETQNYAIRFKRFRACYPISDGG